MLCWQPYVVSIALKGAASSEVRVFAITTVRTKAIGSNIGRCDASPLPGHSRRVNRISRRLAVRIPRRQVLGIAQWTSPDVMEAIHALANARFIFDQEV
jgi:hypothetical protein